jgi:hypothetical protein
MTGRLAAFSLMGALAACHPPAPEATPVPAVAVVAAPVLTAAQVRERAERCAQASGERFRRESRDIVPAGGTAAGTTTAEFASHYNAKLNVCFYLLTVRHLTVADGEVVAPAGTLRKVLFDFGAGEQYGEYVGPVVPGSPWDRFIARCKIEELFCFSEAEWNTIARSYMED